MKILSKINVLILIIFLNIIGFSQTVEDGWKDIKPLKTDKATVNQILGKPEKVDDNDYHNYRTEEAFIRVNYSTAPCKDNQYERGEYNVTEETVLDYWVRPEKAIKLSDFQFKREKYKRVPDQELRDLARYYNEEDGVFIFVGIEDEIEYVGKIYFRPSKQDSEAFKCEEKL